MKALFLICASIALAIRPIAAAEAPDGKESKEEIKFPSPDGRFAISMGTWLVNHYDNATSGWVTDREEKPAAIIAPKTHTVILALTTPLRVDEDKAVWSPDSKRLALNHRGNKTTEMTLFFWNGEAFKTIGLEGIPEVEFKFKAPQNPKATPHVHFNSDIVTPLRWLKSGALVFSRERSVTDTTDEMNYRREYIITVGFDTKYEPTLLDITKQKQQVTRN